MKKLFILSMCFALSTMVLAQQDTTNVKPEWQDGVDYVIKKVENTVNGIAEVLQVPAKHVYKVLITQQIVKSITYSLFGVFTIVFGYLVFMSLKSGYKDYEEHDYTQGVWSTQYIVSSIICGLIFMISLVIFFNHLPIIVTGFVNPEYGALQEIKAFIK